jgi:hypothetical protein
MMLTEIRFHFHLIPRAQQTYTYLQLAISMVIDLGLHHSNADADAQRNEQYSKDPAPCSDSSELCTAEAHRAYLGCYYLSARYSVLGNQKVLFKLTCPPIVLRQQQQNQITCPFQIT